MQILFNKKPKIKKCLQIDKILEIKKVEIRVKIKIKKDKKWEIAYRLNCLNGPKRPLLRL